MISSGTQVLCHLKLNSCTLTKVCWIKNCDFFFKGACPNEIEGRNYFEMVAESLVFQVFNATNFLNAAGYFVMEEEAFRSMATASCNQSLEGDRNETSIRVHCDIGVDSVCYKYESKSSLEPR